MASFDPRGTEIAPPTYNTNPADQKKYLSQRRLRGLGDLFLGIPDLLNAGINAGIRDVDYFTGGGLSDGSYEPYQLPSVSQPAADLAADLSGATIIPDATMPPEVQQQGANQRFLLGALPLNLSGAETAAIKTAETALPAMAAMLPAFKAARPAATTAETVAAAVKPALTVAKPAAAAVAPAASVAETLATAARPVTQTMKHPISGIKLQRPLEEMSASYAPDVPMTPRQDFDFENAPIGSQFTKLLGDRTRAGETLTGVNDLKFETPVKLEGGSDFIRGPQQQADQAFWASEPSQATTIQNRIRALQETGDPVYAAHVSMASQSGDFSRQTTNTLLQMLKQKPVAKEAAETFDRAMRTDWGKSEFKAVPDFPGINNVTDDWLSKTSGINRSKIAKLMDTGRFRDLGFPDVGAARKAVTVPELLDVPALSTGHNIAKVGPEAVHHLTDPKYPHADYARQLAPGAYAGSSQPIPMEIFWSDWMKTQKPGLTSSQLQRSFLTQPVVQRKTQEWLDKLMAYKVSDEGKKLGLAGAIGAGLITGGEAKELFGYEDA